MCNKAIFMQGTNNMVVKDVPMPEIKENEVLIKVDVVGICGSDVHYYTHGKIGSFVVEGDFILGHECAGEVVEIGKNVKNLVVGDRVALEPGKTCGKCEFCKSGKYNLCTDVEFFATPPYHGVFTNYVAHPEDMCFKLPENVSNTEGALVEPLAVGLHATDQGGVKLGNTVVIFGTGCIGLVTLLSAKAKGASNVIVVDVLENRLQVAEKIGATHVINAKTTNVIEKIAELTNGRGADVVIDTAGAEITLKQTVDVVRRGGTIVLVGMTPKDEVEFDFMKLMGKEAEIKTVFRYRNLYPTAINAIASGSLNVKDIVSHEFEFDKTKEAFDFVAGNASDVVKAVIKIK
ncbi:NAD(P)-dependent alcohol dehydrogenase [Serpentinicella alkaliphila]|uniref:L-iditol 2-dehydrogenase n=1 Tax=Serpentinicella alkaliphila TaxID=1734049 RepID=A0A4R2TUV8_9FIRM|nr:NAD(P)-dependent alcohol dehydrogenase [Serpentinicella alkaliphila]QUH27114.1 NAD(P)-dependent alcohol dehydrogenase [Serpentinicella alkaliphila]TCQ05245.1 L-iditol 2-dehydrogenase [Serpentinicella alkaliphila]